MLKYFHPITHKKDAPEDKDPPEGKELSNLPGPYLSKVIPPSSSWSIASYLYNADVTRVLKQAKRSFTYTKLTQSSTEMWNLQVFNPHEHIIIPQ